MSEDKSRLFGKDRWLDLDRFGDWQEKGGPLEVISPIYDNRERPPDPNAYVLRCIMRDYLNENQRETLIEYYFEGRTLHEIAKRRNVTYQSVQSMLRRAKNSLRRAIELHADDYDPVPESEL